MNKIQVVAGIIMNSEKKMLITKRKKHLSNGGKWEFPGGKVEKNEKYEEALHREIFEELKINIEILSFFDKTETKIKNKIIVLSVFFAKCLSGTIKMVDHDDYKWIDIIEIDNFLFSDADFFVTEKLKVLNKNLHL